jgi:hypothetical protein
MKEGTFKKREKSPENIVHWATESYLCGKGPKIMPSSS